MECPALEVGVVDMEGLVITEVVDNLVPGADSINKGDTNLSQVSNIF